MLSWTFLMLTNSQVHSVVRIETDGPRDALHRPIQRLYLDSVGVLVIRSGVELVFGERRLDHDFLMLRQFRLAAKTSIWVVVLPLAPGEQRDRRRNRRTT